jgi:hypothetical protein
MSVHIFAGPTLRHAEIRSRISGATTHPPVRHGDLLRLRLRAGDVVLIIDGVFHHELPVRHKEILNAMSEGATVIGASSMGALRAAELHGYGMVGVGSIFEMYRDGVIDADDEVAVTHGPPPDWQAQSEALVNIRHAIQLGVDACLVPQAHVQRILDVARRLPYPRRTWPMVERESAVSGGEVRESVAAVRKFLATDPDAGNLKRKDALQAIDQLNQATFTRSPGAELGWTAESQWRTIHLAQWLAMFREPATLASPVSSLALFHYQQIYDSSFPGRWESYVLGQIVQSASEAPPAHLSLPEQALFVATRPPLGLELLTEDQKTAWLTPEELASRGDAELMIRVLVRSSNRYSNLDATRFVADCLNAHASHVEPAVTDAYATNHEATRLSPEMHIDNLHSAALRAHLGLVWEMAPGWGARHLAAAARDRGFVSIHEAVEAVRPFYLKSTGHRPSVGGADETPR